MLRFICSALVAFQVVLLAEDALARENRWGVRLAVSNEGAPLAGIDYYMPIGKYLAITPSIERGAGESGGWLALDFTLRIPLDEQRGIFFGGGAVSLVGHHRGDGRRVIVPEAIVLVGGRRYAYAKMIGAHETRIAVGGGFRF